jgi:hypothetical protein
MATYSFLPDIQSLLVEVGGDVELAAARISDGTFFLHFLHMPHP